MVGRADALSHIARVSRDVITKRGLTLPGGDESVEIPTWGVAIIIGTVVVFTVFLASIDYTLEDLVATLAMIETPTAAVTITPSTDNAEEPDAPLDKEKEQRERLLETGIPSITLVQTKPITSKIRTTLRHLREQAGFWSRWRGLGAGIVYSTAFLLCYNILDNVIPHVFFAHDMIISSLSAILLARLHVTWTHAMISMPSTKRWYQRIPPVATWKQLWLPAAIKAASGHVALYLSLGVGFLLRLGPYHDASPDFKSYNGWEWAFLVGRIFLMFVSIIAIGIFVVLPASVTLKRIEASLLPDEEDTIVPFDRSFGGKVVPAVLGGTGAIGFIDAWRTFNWEARRRLIKLYVKIWMIVTALMVVLMHVLLLEIWAIMGPAMVALMVKARDEGMRM